MTSSTGTEVETRKRGGQRRPRNMATALGAAFVAAALALGSGVPTHSWPSERYRDDPVGFFHNVLGFEPWEKQIEIAEAVRDNPRVAVRSGNKAGKSTTCAGLALWFWASFEDARVVLTATTDRQVNGIIWRELKRLLSRHGWCVDCKRKNLELARAQQPTMARPCPHSHLIADEPGGLARTGLKAADFREIVGYTASEAEALAGVSGKNILYIADEASGIEDAIFEAIEGNRAGGVGARLVMISNPTRTEGTFFEAFQPAKAAFYRCIHIDSEQNPNCRAGRTVIEGLADPTWIAEKRAELGVDSAFYKVRVKGEFCMNEAGKVLSLHAIDLAEKAWDTTPAIGRLQIGLDPAGEGEGADESVIACRRGDKITRIVALQGQSAEALLQHVLGVIAEERTAHEVPVVVLDAEGHIGARVYGTFRAHADAHGDAFELAGVRSSRKAMREPARFELVRDELWESTRKWMAAGGAIPADAKLRKDLHAPSWTENVRKQARIPPKEELKKLLGGRSPDRGDAVCLAVWVPSGLRDEELGVTAKRSASARAGGELDDELAFDPYRRSDYVDPYGDGSSGEDDL